MVLTVHNIDNLPVFDIVDFRDFIVGSRDGGLVVSLPDGFIARAPYMSPYVSLVTRAKIPASSEIDLSIRLWEMNEKFFEGIKPTVKLKDADKYFQRLMKYIGFKASTPLCDICAWHKKRLIGIR
jgi:hypothetical protein